MKTVKVISPVELTADQLTQLKKVLGLNPTDKITQQLDQSVIAGLLVEVDGAAVDMTIKRQLAEIARG